MADERIAGYRVDREISRSTIASVYQGYQESLQRKVLIKRLHPQFVRDREIRARFEREAHALARIKHKNIVHIYDYRADDELMLLVSEWIAGGSVSEFIRRHGPLDEAAALALAIDVLEGLQVAHAARVIHRDIKPGNLLLAGSTVKITDFGLAHFEGSPAVTQQGAVMGTPAYMAPEVVSGRPATANCDLYSFGVTLYEVLSGENPFQAGHVSQTLQNVLAVKPDRLEGVHAETNRLLQALMAKDPNQRPESAGAALAMIEPVAKELAVERGWEAVAERIGERERADHHSAPERGGPESDHSIRPARKPAPSRKVVVAAWTAMVLITAAVWLLSPGPSERAAGVNAPAEDSARFELAQLPQEPEVRRPADTSAAQAGGETDRRVVERPAEEPAEPGVESDVPPAVEPGGNADIDSASAPASFAGGAAPAEETGARERERAAETGAAEPAGRREATGDDRPAAADSGYVVLTVNPWANVYHGTRKLGTTPLRRPLHLPAGRVRIELDNPQFPPASREISVPPHDTAGVTIDLFDEVGVIEFINAEPWAEVSLDGNYLGTTPIHQQLIVQPDRHTLVFRHPALPDRDTTFTITAGGEPIRMFIDLTRAGRASGRR
ncbi:MAG: Serine/threonine-protein kinase PknL [Calditrichaeota bacterium]|nr:Serine/threonine-protein kinase PknL [Calditrichota bacterium]